MDTAAYLHDEGCRFVNYEARETSMIVIANPELGSKPIQVPVTFKTAENAASWLEADAANSSIRYSNQTASRLRLLVCKWDATDKSPVRMPFENRESMEKVLKLLETPRYYLYDFGCNHYVPLRLMIEGTETERSLRLNVVCQTPQFSSYFATTALSYDPATRTTTGFQGHKSWDQSDDPLKDLNRMSTCSTHPLLLPVLIYSAYCSKLSSELQQVQDQIRRVERKTGQVLDVSSNDKESAAQSENASQSTFESLHKTLVDWHAILTNSLSDFITEMGPACENALSTIEVVGLKELAISEVAHHDVKLFVTLLLTAARDSLQRRERLLSRVSIQLQVLYNLMQQKISNQAMQENTHMKNIASLTLKDSSAMKSIALLTMVFLPSTAIASIFSISSFFQTGADGSGLFVSDKFWIFWVVSLPITFVVVMIWVAWTQRKEIVEYVAEWRRRRHENAVSMPQPDSEKGRLGTTNIKSQ